MGSRNIVIDTDNMNYIKKVMKEKNSNEFFWNLAWGSSMSSSKVVNQSKKMIIDMSKELMSEVTLKQLTTDDLELKEERATHPLYLGLIKCNSKWYLSNYPMPPEEASKEQEIKGEETKNKEKGKV